MIILYACDNFLPVTVSVCNGNDNFRGAFPLFSKRFCLCLKWETIQLRNSCLPKSFIHKKYRVVRWVFEKLIVHQWLRKSMFPLFYQWLGLAVLAECERAAS